MFMAREPLYLARYRLELASGSKASCPPPVHRAFSAVPLVAVSDLDERACVEAEERPQVEAKTAVLPTRPGWLRAHR
jgi:hypothetical protein